MRCILVLLPILLLACASPAVSQSRYPQNPAVSDALGQPRDSSTFYFPEALLSTPDSATGPWAAELTPQAEYWREVLSYASTNLAFFGAPMLSNYYLGTETYRFLLLRSFHRPVLLTLTRQAAGATLRTQFLDKAASTYRMESIPFIPPDASQAVAGRLQREFDQKQKDPKVQRELAKHNRPAKVLTKLENTRPLTSPQWQQFEQLLQQCAFQQLSICGLSTVTDGASWILEAHTAGGYHAVFRHSPDKQDSFRQACEYLLDLSSARREKRY